MPLQDLPNLSVQGSMLRTNKRKLRGSVSEGLDSECTPRELIQQCSPTLKHQRPACRGKENDGEPFVLARRSRRKKESASGKDPTSGGRGRVVGRLKEPSVDVPLRRLAGPAA